MSTSRFKTPILHAYTHSSGHPSPIETWVTTAPPPSSISLLWWEIVSRHSLNYIERLHPRVLQKQLWGCLRRSECFPIIPALHVLDRHHQSISEQGARTFFDFSLSSARPKLHSLLPKSLWTPSLVSKLWNHAFKIVMFIFLRESDTNRVVKT